MKLILDFYDLTRRFGDFEAAKMLKAAGFDGLDYPFYGSITLQETEHYLAFRDHLAALNLRCPQAHAPFEMRHGMEFSESCPEYAKILRCFEICAILGVKQIVVHALNMPEGQEADFDQYNYNYYKSLEPYAKKAGLKIAVENLFRRDRKRGYLVGVMGTPEHLCRMVQSLGEQFTACIDIGHAALVGMEPEDFIAGMTPGVLGCLHVQDVDYKEDRHTLPFVGDLHWYKIMESLKAIGYEGNFTYEILTFLRRFPDELYSDALAFAHTVGRNLMEKIDKKVIL